MATRYVWSGATGTGAGTSFVNAYTAIATAIAAGSAGDTYLIADDHTETFTGSTTITFPGTNTNPDRIFSTNRGTGLKSAGAFFANTGAGADYHWRGSFYCYGLTVKSGPVGASVFMQICSGSGDVQKWENPTFHLAASSGYLFFTNGSPQTRLRCTLINPTFLENAGGFSNITTAYSLCIKGGSVSGSNVTSPFLQNSGAAQQSYVTVEGMDLSVFGSGKTLFDINNDGNHTQVKFKNCKLGSGVTVTSLPAAPTYADLDLIDCSSGNTIHRNERYWYQGTLTTETVIVRTGGFSDGIAAASWKIVSSANNKQEAPFNSFEGIVFNPSPGISRTLTVHVVTDNVTLLESEIWLEVDYLGSSATPVSTRVSDGVEIAVAGSNQTSDSGTAWTTTGLTTPVKQKLDVTFTPQMSGLIRWRVCFAKASSTVYICPKADLS